MRTVLEDGTPVRIVFHHTEFDTPQPYVRQGHNKHEGEVVDIVSDTACFVVVDVRDEWERRVLAEGHSRRSVLDKPENAETRRQRALGRAIEEFGRVDRGRLLKAYFERPKGSVGPRRPKAGPGAVQVGA